MDLNSSLDDIIGSRKKDLHRRKPHSSSSSSISLRHSSSSSLSTSRGTSRHDLSQQSDLRSRISHNSKTGDWHRGVEKPDLRGRIGKHGISSGGLTTASLPNRQRYQQRGSGGASSYSYDNNNSDMGRQDPHELIITKTVTQRGVSPSSHSPSPSSLARTSRTGAGKGRVGGEVDPTSIVITKKIEKTKNRTSSSSPPPSFNDNVAPIRQHQQHQDIQQQINEAEQLKQYLQQQQDQQLRQQMDRHLQQQLQSQRELILDLQRQLDQRTQQSFMEQQQQQQALHFGSSNFSFRDPVNNNNQHGPSVPPYNQSAPNIVILSNLDPNATANDVKTACGAFGPVIRCELMEDTRGRSTGEAGVEYLDRQSALDCISTFNNEIVDGRLIRATLHQPPTQQAMRSVIAPTRSGYRTTSQVLYTSKRP